MEPKRVRKLRCTVVSDTDSLTPAQAIAEIKQILGKRHQDALGIANHGNYVGVLADTRDEIAAVVGRTRTVRTDSDGRVTTTEY